MNEASPLPTVVLEEGAMYWVKPSYGDAANRWTVAMWNVGSFWGLDKREVTPAVISGPIPPPQQVEGEEG